MKQNHETLTRREFFKFAGLGTGAIVFFSMLPKAQAADQSLAVTIGRNHGHSFSVTLKALLEKGPHDYNIKGSALHPHTLTITQQILDTLLDSKVVDIESSFDAGHIHVVRLQIVEP